MLGELLYTNVTIAFTYVHKGLDTKSIIHLKSSDKKPLWNWRLFRDK